MSQLWSKDAAGAWAVQALDADVMVLGGPAPAPLVAPEALGAAAGPALARSRGVNGHERWTLLCDPASRARVNGAPVAAGARVLTDRDAIALGDGRIVYFSAERLAETVPFPGGPGGAGRPGHARSPTSCIRCKLPLDPGTPAVRCPAPDCGFWAHESEELPCWSYTEGCAACGHPTALDAGLQWSPAEL